MATATRGRDKVEVFKELAQAGATTYGLLKSESRFLPKFLHQNERVHAIVYGQHHSSSAMLVATDERVIYLDKKPTAVFLDEVTYDVVSGIEIDIHTLFATVTLHTAVTNYVIRFANIKCATVFVSYIEEQRLKRELEKENAQGSTPDPMARNELIKQVASTMVSNNLAGYYWYPNDEEREEAI